MIEAVLSEVELVCPKCRALRGGELIQFPLSLESTKIVGGFATEGYLVCANPECKTHYPIIDGVPIIIKNLKEWVVGHLGSSFHDKPTGLLDIKTYFNNSAVVSKQKDLVAQYMTTHYGECTNSKNLYQNSNKQYWKKICSVAKPKKKSYGLTLDLGCSVGRFTNELAKWSKLAVGMDSNFYAVKEAVKIQCSRGKIGFVEKSRALETRNVIGRFNPADNVFFLVGDALDPPFRMEHFDLVAALNLLDTVSVPLTLLGQMDALLTKGGSLLLGSPYCWNAQVTASSEWLETELLTGHEMVKGILEGKIHKQCGFKYTVEKEIRGLLWSIKGLDSYYSVYLTNLILATNQSGF